MNFWNDKLLREALADYARKFRKVGLGTKIEEIESRLEKLEAKRRPGRPKKEES